MNDVKDPQFDSVLQGFAPETLQSERSTVVGLWSDLTFAYFNEEWLLFAAENDGPDEEQSRAYLGQNLLDVIADDMKDTYRDFFRSAWYRPDTERHPVRMEYDCHSPQTYRRMSMTIFPAQALGGLLIVHSKVRDAPLKTEFDLHHPRDRHEYANANDLVDQCAHCRRVKHPAEEGRWDMVPALIEKNDLRISHTLCHFCRDMFWTI